MPKKGQKKKRYKVYATATVTEFQKDLIVDGFTPEEAMAKMVADRDGIIWTLEKQLKKAGLRKPPKKLQRGDVCRVISEAANTNAGVGALVIVTGPHPDARECPWVIVDGVEDAGSAVAVAHLAFIARSEEKS